MELIITETIGYIAAVMTVFSLVPQLVKILKNKDSKDLSLMSFYLYILVQILWISYGVGRGDLQIIISNALCCLLSIMIIGFSLYYKNNNVIDNIINV
jgi:MtN3 and saliva related transmembrane protein